MSVTNLAAVADQIQKFWSPLFMNELREKLLLGALVNKDYEGQIKTEGDTVRVSQINAPKGQLRTVGVDADNFETDTLSTVYVDVKADKRAVAGFKITDLAKLQSQIQSKDTEIRDSLMFAVEKQVNDYLYSLVAPSASAPAHVLSTVTAFNAAQLLAVRKLAAKAKWLKNKGWWLLMDPSYYNDILSAATLISKDYVQDSPVVGGQVSTQRYGFNILEDDSRADQKAIAFHPDFMHLVTQKAPQFKISDLHPTGEFGYNLTVDLIFGAAQGIDGSKKVISIKNT